MTELRDITVIGAGPVGMFAVFEAGMHELSCHLVDALPQVGGQLAALYPEKPIYDIPCFPEILARDVCLRLEEQMRPVNPAIHLDQTVVSVEKVGDEFHCRTHAGLTLRSRTVFLAAGKGAFEPHRPTVSGIEPYEGKSLFYMVKDSKALLGKRIVIQGGGDSALDWAVQLASSGSDVTLIHRRDGFRALPKTVSDYRALVQAGRAKMLVPSVINAVDGDAASGQIRALLVQSSDGERWVEADVWLPLLGYSSQFGLIKEWGLELEHHGCVHVQPHSMETSRPGIYAMGDIAFYPGKRILILSGFAESAMAVKDAYRYCRPDQSFSKQHSSSTGVRTTV